MVGGSVDLGDLELYYEVSGSGSPLVLLHNFAMSGVVFGECVSALAEAHRVVVIDLPGHGRSSGRSGRWTHRQAAVDVLAALDRLEIHGFDAIGVSSGAMTLLHCAVMAPERLGRLGLIAGTTRFPDSARAFMRQMAPDNPAWENFAGFHPDAERFEQVKRHFHTFADHDDDMVFSSDQLGAITAETLIMHGDRDPLFEVGIAVDLYQAVPNAYLWVVPDATHTFFREPRGVDLILGASRFLDHR